MTKIQILVKTKTGWRAVKIKFKMGSISNSPGAMQPKTFKDSPTSCESYRICCKMFQKKTKRKKKLHRQKISKF